MKRLLRVRPRHATVAAYLALFLALAGGAVAAATIGSGDVIDGSLKSVDLKNGKGVRGGDVAQGSLNGSDVRAGSLRGAQLADDSLTGSDVDEPSLAVGQVVNRLGGFAGNFVPMPVPLAMPNGAYRQAAGETNVYIAGGQVNFSATCVEPREATIYLLLDSPTPAPGTIVGEAQVDDNNTGGSARHFTFGSPSGAGEQGQTVFRRPTAVDHQFYVYATGSCSSGAGIALGSVGVDVVAKR